MSRKSLFKFYGELLPSELIPEIRAGYALNRPAGSFGIEVDGRKVTIEFVASYESFDELYLETYELALAFFSVGAIRLGIPIQLQLQGWTEHPLQGSGEAQQLRPVRGTISTEDPDAIAVLLMPDQFTFGLANGVMWAEDLATNSFLRRAVLDFNFALNHPLQDVPIYLARSIESVQVFFQGENELISVLEVGSQVKKVKRMANDALSGLHTRHAAKTEKVVPLSRQEVIDAANATRDVLTKFQMYLMGKRIQRDAQIDQGLGDA